MSVYEPNSRHLREVLIFCFNMKKFAAEAHRMLSNTYGEAAISERTYREYFNASRTVILTSKTGIAVEERRFSKMQNWRILEQDSYQNQEELARSLGVTQQAISKRLKANHGNDSQARKLGAVRIEAERC